MSGCTVRPGSGSTDERIRLIAGAQQGVVAWQQLLAAGIHRNAIKRRVQNGLLIRRHRNVYVVAPQIDAPLVEETAALLAIGPDCALSHHSSATIRGLRPGTARPIHVTVNPRQNGPRPNGVVVHRSRTLAAKDIEIVHGLAVTSAERTVLDIASTLPDRDIERVVVDGYAKRLFTRRKLEEVLARAGGHPGRWTLARVLAEGNPRSRTEAPGEEKLYELLVQADLPLPETQAVVLDYRVDFLWRDIGLAVEVDGYATHSSRAASERDRRKDARLLNQAGITVVQIAHDTVDDRPLLALATVAQAVARHRTVRERR